jgi:hypothetical protein
VIQGITYVKVFLVIFFPVETVYAEVVLNGSRRPFHRGGSRHRKAKSNKGDGTMSGLNLLVEKYVTQLKELENRIAETKRRLEVITEASHLLVEEGFSGNNAPVHFPDNTPYPENI